MTSKPKYVNIHHVCVPLQLYSGVNTTPYSRFYDLLRSSQMLLYLRCVHVDAALQKPQTSSLKNSLLCKNSSLYPALLPESKSLSQFVRRQTGGAVSLSLAHSSAAGERRAEYQWRPAQHTALSGGQSQFNVFWAAAESCITVRLHVICRQTQLAHLTPQRANIWQYVTLDHKTCHRGTFLEIEVYASSESWINKLSIVVWFGQY